MCVSFTELNLNRGSIQGQRDNTASTQTKTLSTTLRTCLLDTLVTFKVIHNTHCTDKTIPFQKQAYLRRGSIRAYDAPPGKAHFIYLAVCIVQQMLLYCFVIISTG